MVVFFFFFVLSWQIKYEELPNFQEVMAAGTAAALVPIQSITRRIEHSSPNSLATKLKSHPRLEVSVGQEKITYLPESQTEAGPLCQKLLAKLKGIQLGKIKDEFNWCFPVSEEDGSKVAPRTAGNGAAGPNGQSVDSLD